LPLRKGRASRRRGAWNPPTSAGGWGYSKHACGLVCAPLLKTQPGRLSGTLTCRSACRQRGLHSAQLRPVHVLFAAQGYRKGAPDLRTRKRGSILTTFSSMPCLARICGCRHSRVHCVGLAIGSEGSLVRRSTTAGAQPAPLRHAIAGSSREALFHPAAYPFHAPAPGPMSKSAPWNVGLSGAPAGGGRPPLRNQTFLCLLATLVQ